MRKSKVFSVAAFAAFAILAGSATAEAQDYRPHYRVETPRGNPQYGRVAPYEARREAERHAEMERLRRQDELRRYNRPQGYYGSRPYYDRYGQYRSGGVYRGHRGARYEVTDYRRHNLPPPRAGYRYYRDNDDNIIMVAVATGIIAAIIANR